MSRVFSGVFDLEEFYSIDDVLDASDSRHTVTNLDGSEFRFTDSIKAGATVTLRNIKGWRCFLCVSPLNPLLKEFRGVWTVSNTKNTIVV